MARGANGFLPPHPPQQALHRRQRNESIARSDALGQREASVCCTNRKLKTSSRGRRIFRGHAQQPASSARPTSWKVHPRCPRVHRGSSTLGQAPGGRCTSPPPKGNAHSVLMKMQRTTSVPRPWRSGPARRPNMISGKTRGALRPRLRDLGARVRSRREAAASTEAGDARLTSHQLAATRPPS